MLFTYFYKLQISHHVNSKVSSHGCEIINIWPTHDITNKHDKGAKHKMIRIIRRNHACDTTEWYSTCRLICTHNYPSLPSDDCHLTSIWSPYLSNLHLHRLLFSYDLYMTFMWPLDDPSLSIWLTCSTGRPIFIEALYLSSCDLYMTFVWPLDDPSQSIWLTCNTSIEGLYFRSSFDDL